MNIVITGTTGLIGTALVELFDTNAKVVSIKRRDDLGTEQNELWNYKSPLPTSLPSRVNVVIHCAAATGKDPCTDGNDCFQVNVWATEQLLRYARSAGAELFVFLSTGSVHGLASQPLDEQAPLRPEGAYACSKLAGEALVRAHDPFMPTLIVRLFYPYGPEQKFPRLIPRLFHHVRQHQTIRIHGEEGKPQINPVHVRDVARWLQILVQQRVQGTFHCAGSEVISIRSLAERIGTLVGIEPTFEIGDPVSGDCIGNIQALIARTGYTPQWSLEQGLQEVSRT